MFDFWQWMDLSDQHDQDKLGGRCGYDGRGRLLHCKRHSGDHPAENGMAISNYTASSEGHNLNYVYTNRFK